MKISRQKKISKILNFYINNFGFHSPFQILIDGTYCYAALKNQHNIQEVLPKYFQSELKLLTTPCVVVETEKLGSKVIGAAIILKQFAIHKCVHGGNYVSGSKCIQAMIKEMNKNRYVIATQDRELQDYIRNQAIGVPLLYLHQKTPVLENPSDRTVEHTKINKTQRFQLNKNEESLLTQLKVKNGIQPHENGPNNRKKRRKGGPNPLSCKKKKKVLNDKEIVKNNSDNKIKKNRKRKRVRIPEHVKQELLQSK